MIKLMKRTVTVCLAFVLCLVIVSCGNTEQMPESTGTDQPTENDGTETDDPTTEATGSLEGQSISFWYMGDSTSQLEPIASDFTAESGVTIDIQAIPWNGLTEKLLAAISSRSGPDSMQTAVSRTAELVAADAILDLTDEIASTPEFSLDNFFDVSYNSLKIDDKYYGVPWIADVYPLFYRTDIFADAGYTEFPKTWEALFEASQKIHEQTGNYTLDIITVAYDYNFLMSFPFQAGSEVVSENREPLFTEPEMKTAVEYIMSYIDEGLSSDIDDGVERQIKLANGDIAACSGGSWLIPLVEAIPELKGKWGMAALPEGPGGKSAVYAGSNLVITTWTDKVDASLAWFEHLVTKENILKHYELASALPPRKDAWTDLISQSDVDMSVFEEQLEMGKTFPMIPEMQEIGIDFTKYMERIMVGKEDIDTVLEELNQRATEILSRGR